MGSEVLRVVGYIRVSTDEQSRDGVGLADQAEKVRRYCELHGLDLVATLADPGESGKSLDRPALREALGWLDDGRAQGIVVAKLDRLTRSIGDWAELIGRYFGEAKPCRLFSVGDSIDTRTASGRMVLNVIMSVAQAEREQIVERTSAALAYKRSKGERLGTIPYGSRLAADGRTLEDDATERATVGQILAWAAAGRSDRRIAAELNAEGVPTKTGKGPWRPSSVRSIRQRRSA